MDEVNNANAQFLANLLGGSADTYKVDLKNYKTVNEKKIAMIEELDKKIKEVNGKMMLSSMIAQMEANNQRWTGVQSETGKKAVADAKKYQNEIDELWRQKENIKNIDIPDLQRTLNNPLKNLDKIQTDLNKTSNKNNSSSNKNTEKTISKIEEEIDRYHDLKETIETTKQSLDSLSNAKETAFGDNKINLINQEINKYGELARKENNLLLAYKNRMNEVRNALRGRGITFDGNGAMTNYYSLLTSVENSLNNQMNADNQKALQEQWKTLKKLADEYTSLYENDIPNATKAINDANKNIYNSRKDLLDSMMNSETKVSDIIKKSINDEIELREKQLEALQKLHEEEKQGEKLAKNEEDLIKLRNQMDKVEGVDNKKYAELKQQYDELLQTSNSDIRDDVYDKQNKALEEEKGKYDKLMNDADRMTKLVQDALNTGVVTIFGETKNIQEEMVKLVNEENIGLQNRASNLKEINDLLRESKSIMSQIGAIDNQLGLNGYISKVTPSNTNNINLGNSTYNISGMDENKVRNIVQKEMNSSFERIAKQLGLKI